MLRHEPSQLHRVDKMITEYKWKGGGKKLLKVGKWVGGWFGWIEGNEVV